MKNIVKYCDLFIVILKLRMGEIINGIIKVKCNKYFRWSSQVKTYL